MRKEKRETSSAIGWRVSANSNKIMVVRECKRSRNVADLCQERTKLVRVNMRVRRVVRRSVVDDGNGTVVDHGSRRFLASPSTNRNEKGGELGRVKNLQRRQGL